MKGAGKGKFNREEVLLVAAVMAAGLLADSEVEDLRMKAVVDKAESLIREVDSREEIGR